MSDGKFCLVKSDPTGPGYQIQHSDCKTQMRETRATPIELEDPCSADGTCTKSLTLVILSYDREHALKYVCRVRLFAWTNC